MSEKLGDMKFPFRRIDLGDMDFLLEVPRADGVDRIPLPDTGYEFAINTVIELMIAEKLELDDVVAERTGTRPGTARKVLALFDELGELNHELKSEWCWWMSNPPELKRDKILDELADVWHLAIGYWLVTHTSGEFKYNNNFEFFGVEYTLCHVYTSILSGKYILEWMLFLTELLGFSLSELYQAYTNKNKLNRERQQNGY